MIHIGRNWKLYRDRQDWWMGAFVTPGTVYVCVLPTLVIRYQRRGQRPEDFGGKSR